jgi:hypothetical protein
MAVTGFLLFLKNFKVLGGFSCSQASQVSLASSEVGISLKYDTLILMMLSYRCRSCKWKCTSRTPRGAMLLFVLRLSAICGDAYRSKQTSG